MDGLIFSCSYGRKIVSKKLEDAGREDVHVSKESSKVSNPANVYFNLLDNILLMKHLIVTTCGLNDTLLFNWS